MSQEFYKEAELEIKDPNDEKLIFKNKAMIITRFGDEFYEICNKEIE